MLDDTFDEIDRLEAEAESDEPRAPDHQPAMEIFLAGLGAGTALGAALILGAELLGRHWPW